MEVGRARSRSSAWRRGRSPGCRLAHCWTRTDPRCTPARYPLLGRRDRRRSRDGRSGSWNRRRGSPWRLQDGIRDHWRHLGNGGVGRRRTRYFGTRGDGRRRHGRRNSGGRRSDRNSRIHWRQRRGDHRVRNHRDGAVRQLRRGGWLGAAVLRTGRGLRRRPGGGRNAEAVRAGSPRLARSLRRGARVRSQDRAAAGACGGPGAGICRGARDPRSRTAGGPPSATRSAARGRNAAACPAARSTDRIGGMPMRAIAARDAAPDLGAAAGEAADP